jgi:hypothetical protein
LTPKATQLQTATTVNIHLFVITFIFVGTGIDYDSDSVGIDLSHSCVTEHEELLGTTPLKDQQLDQQPSTSAFPSAPSQPDAVLTDENDILLSWKVPNQAGTASEILGYLVEFRRSDTDPWEPAHDELLVDNECRGK